MPRSETAIFQSPKTHLFYLVNTKGRGGVVGEYASEKEAKQARRMMPEFLRSLEDADMLIRPQPAAECDVREVL